MAVGAVVENGKIVTSATQESLSKTNTTTNKDDFLQLLVAQMKYQDPMEPTENTEWVSQYAQFSQVEELQNMAQNMTLQRASGLVGQTVIMNVEGDNGKVTEIQGAVDFVSYEGNKAFLSINGELYSMDDLKYVVDAKYAAAIDNAEGFEKTMKKLPAIIDLTIDDLDAVATAAEKYDALTDREKEMLGDSQAEYEKMLDEYVSRMTAIVNDAKAQAEAASAAGETNPSGTGETEISQAAVEQAAAAVTV